MFKKEKDEMISKQEAHDKIVSWADQLEIDPDSDGFKDVIEAIQYSVRKERLVFQPETMNFKYVLLSPIEKKDDSTPISVVEISEMTMQQKKGIQRYKDTEGIDRAISLMAAALNMEDQIGFVTRLKDRDTTTINAVITGFYVGAGS